MDRAHAVCPGCPVYPLSSFLIGASSQFQETSERMADEEERILQLVELLARTRIRIMKSDDCPHGSAPIVLDLPPNAAVPYGGDNLLSTGLSIFWSDIGQMSQGRCPEAAWRRSQWTVTADSGADRGRRPVAAGQGAEAPSFPPREAG